LPVPELDSIGPLPEPLPEEPDPDPELAGTPLLEPEVLAIEDESFVPLEQPTEASETPKVTTHTANLMEP
jgi:hypothetical protein